MDDRVITEAEQHVCDRTHQHVVIAARKVSSSDGACEQRVADQQVRSDLACLPNLQTDASWAVAGGMVYPDFVVSEADRLQVVETVNRRRLFDVETKHASLLDSVFVERTIVSMEMHRCDQRALRCRHAGDVIDVCVRQKDVPDVELVRRDGGKKVIDLVARIDNNGFAGSLAANHEAIFVKRWSLASFENHIPVLCTLHL